MLCGGVEIPPEWIYAKLLGLDRHGEARLEAGNSSGLGGYWHRDDEQGGDTWDENSARYQSMVLDAFPHQYAWMDDQPAEDFEEESNPEAKKFFDLLAFVRKPLWEGSAFRNCPLRLGCLQLSLRITTHNMRLNKWLVWLERLLVILVIFQKTTMKQRK
ncbi:hypothetical protein PIB30_038276 [Stylosanthes scabra]|uniref:Uncharacterized protein n=1 Tax=Stylosanthes scabra TaxID=79078 RepID=A0ABU6ZCM6_9FABA|nr:hypothetical protein [Stylosanthes scabra]